MGDFGQTPKRMLMGRAGRAGLAPCRRYVADIWQLSDGYLAVIWPLWLAGEAPPAGKAILVEQLCAESVPSGDRARYILAMAGGLPSRSIVANRQHLLRMSASDPVSS